MGQGFGGPRHWTGFEGGWQHHPHGGRGGWGGWESSRGGRSGPPPWLAGLFGLAQGSPGRGPRVRRGDVRAAILDVLRAEPLNGYQVIQEIGDRTSGAWRPSPGSVYPTISQLEDEGLVEAAESGGRRAFRLTDAGRAYAEDNAEELAAVWEPFETGRDEEETTDFATLKPEIGAVMNAVWQILTTGTDQQRRDAVDILVETRRRLYGLLAEGDPE